MALFSQPVPIAPNPRGGSAAVREGDTIKALVETRSVVAKIDGFLKSFGINSITSADGRIYDSLSRDGGGQGAAKALVHPWTITMKQIGEAWKFGVSNKSDVYDGVTWTKKTVTGLLTDPENEADPGWQSPRVGFVFLWGTVAPDTGEVTKIEIKNDQTDLENIKRVDSADGKQTQFAHVLGYLWSEGGGDETQWYYRQESWRHVTLLYVVVNGILCKVPFEM